MVWGAIAYLVADIVLVCEVGAGGSESLVDVVGGANVAPRRAALVAAAEGGANEWHGGDDGCDLELHLRPGQGGCVCLVVNLSCGNRLWSSR